MRFIYGQWRRGDPQFSKQLKQELNCDPEEFKSNGGVIAKSFITSCSSF